MMLRKRVPVIVPLHEIASAVAASARDVDDSATTGNENASTNASVVPSPVPPPPPPPPPPPTPPAAKLPPQDMAAKPPMRPLRKNKRLRPAVATRAAAAHALHPDGPPTPKIRRPNDQPHRPAPENRVSYVSAKAESSDVDEIRPAANARPPAALKRRADRDKDVNSSVASESHGSTVCSPASSVLGSNDDVSTDALMKIAGVAHQENIVWTKIKGHPYWPAQHVRMSPDLQKQDRFKSAAKFKRRVDDTCVMYFGTCEIAFVNAEKSCISWEDGLKRNMHLSHKSRSVFQRSLAEVKAYCHRNTRYPRGWWCEPPCFVLAADFYDRCIMGTALHQELKPFISTAETELIFWAKIRGFPHWPVQVLPRNMAAERYPQLKLSPESSSASSSIPCMFFGTGEVAMVPEKNCTPFGAGLTRGYVTISDRQDFTVAIGELWGYLQEPRVWPNGYLSGHHWWNYEESKDVKQTDDSSEVYVPHMPHYDHVKKSVWLDGIEPPPRPKSSEVSCCGCMANGKQPSCVDSNCLNFASRFLCNPATCLAGAQCANISFHKRKLPRLKPFFTADQRGWGLKVEEPIKSGSFVIEYVGEIIDREILDKRLKAAQKQRSHEYYMMDLTNDLLVDAKFKGNLSRFINSSCEPNCATQKWTDSVTGHTHVGIFAIQDIPVGTELTYNYCFEDFGLTGKSQKRSFMCQCGTSSCCMLEPEEKSLMKSLIGRRLEVRWDDGWYPGVVETYNFKKKRFRVQYDDGDCEDLVLGLKTEQDDGVAFRLVDEMKEKDKQENEKS